MTLIKSQFRFPFGCGHNTQTTRDFEKKGKLLINQM